ncbi:Arginine--tRNA ligase, cytoplasmic [Thelohanellus kitauei]|uniref:arginine--tRNA ligase n=1 Tax=Thelohanellus kitauei TaxID=669202 RepID=A0A0C2M9V2_THEKT|nr:Arginine--tRNA ligase, cytoplasmic [Thelohanellus kitauei]
MSKRGLLTLVRVFSSSGKIMEKTTRRFVLDEELELHKCLTELQTSNRDQFNPLVKAIYRLNIVDQRYDELNKLFETHMPNTLNSIKYLMYRAVEACGVTGALPNISYAKKGSDYDYQSSDALKFCKNISMATSERLTATEAAIKIISYVPKNDFIESVDVSEPGFINFKLKTDFILDICKSIIIDRNVRPPFVNKRKVVVDFSSPNIAKEMHVGHLRSTIIGESICRIFEFVGFDVVRVSHIGDWGTQFGMLIAYLEEKFPNYAQDPPEISDLQKFYKDSKKRFDEDPEFKKKAHVKVVDLQNGNDPKVTMAWQRICQISRDNFQKLYDRLGVKVTEKGESFYQTRMSKVIEDLVRRGIVEEEGVCKIIRVAGIKVPLILVKSDGGYTYDTSDIATLKYRISEENADWIIYVVDIGQREHFDILFKLGRMVKWYNPEVTRVEHVAFGIVLDENKKRLRTRSGESVKLVDLLDEGVARSKAKLIDRGMKDQFSEDEFDHIAESLAYSCIKYADLSRNLTTDYEFSFDRMLEDRGNTAIYLLYTYARVRSIIRKTCVTEEDIVEYVKTEGLRVEHDCELKLMRKFVHFPEIVFRIVFETFPNILCDYLYELCCFMTEYYDACVIIDPASGKPNMNRLAQIYAASLVLKKGYDLLGLHSLERM